MELGCRTAHSVNIYVVESFLEFSMESLLVSTSAWFVGARRSEMCKTPGLPPESRTEWLSDRNSKANMSFLVFLSYLAVSTS